MKILEIPKKFQPNYKSSYPPYSNGLNLEEIFYNKFKKIKNDISSDRVYLPIFWTSLFIIRNYGANINDLCEFLDNLDKTKKYFTIVQFASGIYWENKNKIDINIISSGGGGIDIKSKSVKRLFIEEINKYRDIFIGKEANYFLPLLCQPILKNRKNIKKKIITFRGNLTTHPLRLEMRDKLKNNKNFLIEDSWRSSNMQRYIYLLDQSMFTLAPRGYGYSSFRLYEAICMGSIPIIIWKDKLILAYNDELNYKDFSIIIHSNDISKIPEIINNLDEKKITTMQENLKKVCKSHFNFDYMLKYIIKKI